MASSIVVNISPKYSTKSSNIARKVKAVCLVVMMIEASLHDGLLFEKTI